MPKLAKKARNSEMNPTHRDGGGEGDGGGGEGGGSGGGGGGDGGGDGGGGDGGGRHVVVGKCVTKVLGFEGESAAWRRSLRKHEPFSEW